MNILHYSLGFPPFRRGGMTKYCIDLIEQQLKEGHNLAMLWPGRIKKYGYKIKIKQNKNYRINKLLECKNYEIINPLPVSLLNGIKNIDEFIQKKDESVFYSFFKMKQIEVIHIHTLMGLPRECIDAAKKLNIRLIYTTHDYFGICPKWGLIYKGKICEDDQQCKRCVECNKTALSLNKIKILQSNMYRVIKDLKIIKSLRKRHNEYLYEESLGEDNEEVNRDKNVLVYAEKYKKLREYYIDMFETMDVIHFNSSNTEKIFSQYFPVKKNGKVINITHSSIVDNKKNKKYTNELNIGYLGPITEHKGFFTLKTVCDQIYENNEYNFKLHIFASYKMKKEYMVEHAPYKYDELADVMNLIDILIVPSLWNETFGFTVLEALSYGVPVIVSKNVGAKDLISEGNSGIIYNSSEELKEILMKIMQNTKKEMEMMNEYILFNQFIKNIETHTKELMQIYNRN